MIAVFRCFLFSCLKISRQTKLQVMLLMVLCSSSSLGLIPMDPAQPIRCQQWPQLTNQRPHKSLEGCFLCSLIGSGSSTRRYRHQAFGVIIGNVFINDSSSHLYSEPEYITPINMYIKEALTFKEINLIFYNTLSTIVNLTVYFDGKRRPGSDRAL